MTELLWCKVFSVQNYFPSRNNTAAEEEAPSVSEPGSTYNKAASVGDVFSFYQWT